MEVTSSGALTKSSTKFRINAKNYFLTYPKCPLAREEVLDELVERFLPRSLAWAVVAHELHKDEGDHLHCQLEFKERYNCINELAFDIKGYHPNVQASRSTSKVAKYCAKEDCYSLYGITPEDFRKKIGYTNPWNEALQAKTAADAIEIIRNGAARDYIINSERIEATMKRLKTGATTYVPIFDQDQPFVVPVEVQSWLDTEFIKKTRARCLCLIGPTKLGKTAWARSIVQPHTYWKSLINIEKWNPASKLLIFDNFDWKYMPAPKVYLTQAGQATVTDKYHKKTNVIVNMPAIFICNEMPLENGVPLDCMKYWQENMVFITVQNKFY